MTTALLLQGSKVYPATMKILATIDGSDGRAAIADNTNGLRGDKAKALYNTWMAKLPLQSLEDFKEFNQMLKENPDVLIAMVNCA